mmetsp:Transcript_21101/g.25379  ORF Transcript_21101/g.25379 Transcript_21101/m.25379 type:complete len:93 (-) Transcript_21101:1457-1735(-)
MLPLVADSDESVVDSATYKLQLGGLSRDTIDCPAATGAANSVPHYLNCAPGSCSSETCARENISQPSSQGHTLATNPNIYHLAQTFRCITRE